ncbi:MAG: prephenate dehydrogenase [Myxococcota bacterium]|nr:prephenate dehydrogenase [Myxococcota bacterium]
MSRLFGRVAVLGLGLLGGSVALAAKRRGVAGCVVGANRRASVGEEALRLGAVDEAASDFPSAVRGAELVVLATPVFAMPEVVRQIAPELGEGALVTDVGSVKGCLADTLPGLLPRGVHYVGAHPMAGSHERGITFAREDLLEGATCVVATEADAAARERVAAFWSALGSRVVWRDSAEHDRDVGWVSHVPHAVAFAFAAALEEAPERAFEVQGSGFRDFTRIAHSDPELWADILFSNRKAVAAPLQAAGRTLSHLARLLEEENTEALERFLQTARSALSRSGAGGSGPAEDQPEPPAAEGPGGAKDQKPIT